MRITNSYLNGWKHVSPTADTRIFKLKAGFIACGYHLTERVTAPGCKNFTVRKGGEVVFLTNNLLELEEALARVKQGQPIERCF